VYPTGDEVAKELLRRREAVGIAATGVAAARIRHVLVVVEARGSRGGDGGRRSWYVDEFFGVHCLVVSFEERVEGAAEHRGRLGGCCGSSESRRRSCICVTRSTTRGAPTSVWLWDGRGGCRSSKRRLLRMGVCWMCRVCCALKVLLRLHRNRSRGRGRGGRSSVAAGPRGADVDICHACIF
jgi:hypothetical protein